MVLALMLIISAVPTAAFAETGEDLSQAAIEINAALREPDKKSKEPEGGFFIIQEWSCHINGTAPLLYVYDVILNH